MMLSVGRRAWLVAIGFVVAAIAGGIAFAAIPDSSGLIHGCYNPNGANARNGTPLNIVNSDTSSCRSNQLEISWNQTGPPGPAGDDGVSVTSSSLSSGDANCPAGGSAFTAAGGNVTYACNGLKGDKGDTGETGPPGPSAAYTNYGDGFHAIGDGLTQTLASLTVPSGSYVLSGAVQAGGVGGGTNLQCSFLSGGTSHGLLAVIVDNGAQPMLGDVTLGLASNRIFLRCFAQGGTVEAAGQMIATKVGAVTPSE